MSNVIGSLFIALGMDSANFQTGAKKAQGTLAALSSSIKGFAAGALGALSLTSVTAVVKSVVDHMDDLGKSAQKVGIPVEALSALEYAAKLADVSLEQLQTSLGKFNKGLGEMATGKLNSASTALRAIGVSATDSNGKLRPTAAIISDIADRFASYEDGAEKSAIAIALFGKSGQEMIPLLNGGAEGLRQATEEARRFGVIVDQEAARSAEEFNDNMERLKFATLGLVQTALAPLLRDAAELVVQFANLIGVGGELKDSTEEVTQSFFNLNRMFAADIADLQKMGAVYTFLKSALTNPTENPVPMWEQMKAEIAGINQELVRSQQLSRQVVNSSAKVSLPNARPAAPVIPDFAGQAREAEKEAKAASKALADLKRDGKEVFDATRTSMEEYQIELVRLSGLLKAGVIDQNTYNRAVAQLKDEFKSTGDTVQTLQQQIGQTIQGELSSWIDAAVDGTFKLQDSLKGLLSTLTKMALNNVFASLIGGAGSHPLYGGGMGSGLSGMLGGLFGFAKGGTIMPGGRGGIDSQLVAFRKSPNERVDITKPGQTLHSSSAPTVVINDYRTNAPKVETTRDGTRIEVLIRDQVNDTLGKGYADGALGGRYGVRPQRVRRGT